MVRSKIVIPPVTLETTLTNARRWLNIIRFGESGTVIQLQDDCEYRVLEIINNQTILKNFLGLYYKKYILRYLPIDQKDIQKAIKDTLTEIATEIKIGTKGILSEWKSDEILNEIAKKGYEVGLFISHVSLLLKNHYFQPFFDLELLIRTSKNLSVVIFSEIDITHEKYSLLVDKASFLYDNITKYPLYGNSDSKQFISHYNYQWKFSLPDRTINEIIEACGGYLWLIHQVHRSLRDNTNMTVSEALKDEVLIRKLEVIWKKFTEEEQSIIQKTYNDRLQKTDILSHEYNYLKSIRVIKQIKGKSVLGIPLLSQVIEKLNQFHVREDSILIGEKDITLSLSNKERALMLLLLAAKKKIVSRDTVAQTIWGASWEEKYSDWALDRLVYRLRIKLNNLGIDPKRIKTLKKKGFIWE